MSYGLLFTTLDALRSTTISGLSAWRKTVPEGQPQPVANVQASFDVKLADVDPAKDSVTAADIVCHAALACRGDAQTAAAKGIVRVADMLLFGASDPVGRLNVHILFAGVKPTSQVITGLGDHDEEDTTENKFLSTLTTPVTLSACPLGQGDVGVVERRCAITEPESLFFAGVCDVKGVIEQLRHAKRVVVMCGAGISVAAGIPDFRTPKIGLYDNLDKYNLPQPEDLFTIDYLREKPHIFYTVANDMKLWPGYFPPTHVHHFIAMLEKMGKLQRCYTQNIDGMERVAGVSPEKLVEAHGTFATARCIECKHPMDMDEVRRIADLAEVPRCPKCSGIVKPDVVFFGEALPGRFHSHLEIDVHNTDLLLVIGTSLVVYPFAMIHEIVKDSVPRVLVNMQRAGSFEYRPQAPTICRDVFLQGDCQAAVVELAAGLGFKDDLETAYRKCREAILAKVAQGASLVEVATVAKGEAAARL